jgi:hypothetical protein
VPTNSKAETTANGREFTRIKKNSSALVSRTNKGELIRVHSRLVLFIVCYPTDQDKLNIRMSQPFEQWLKSVWRPFQSHKPSHASEVEKKSSSFWGRCAGLKARFSRITNSHLDTNLVRVSNAGEFFFIRVNSRPFAVVLLVFWIVDRYFSGVHSRCVSPPILRPFAVGFYSCFCGYFILR